MKRWRAFEKLSGTEKAYLARLGWSSGVLEVCCLPGQSSISVVEKLNAGFHWAYFAADGECRDEGHEDTLDQARQAASEALRLWAHRCAAAGKLTCPGYCLDASSAQPPKKKAAGTKVGVFS